MYTIDDLKNLQILIDDSEGDEDLLAIVAALIENNLYVPPTLQALLP